MYGEENRANWKAEEQKEGKRPPALAIWLASDPNLRYEEGTVSYKGGWRQLAREKNRDVKKGVNQPPVNNETASKGKKTIY